MHPAIRVLCLAALASALPLLGLPDLGLLSLLLLLVFAAFADHALRRLATGLWRLRWLLLGIGVLYWGFTPGEPLWPAFPGLSREGLAEALRRSLVLVSLLTAVYLLLELTPLEELMTAIGCLAAPLQPLGLDARRLALRLALSLHAVGQAQQRLQTLAAGPGRDLVGRAALAVTQIEADSASEDSEPVALPALIWPPLWQWLLPLALGAALHGLAT